MILIDRMTRSSRPLLWDGGVGTALIARGLDLGRESPEDWLTSHPDAVRAVHAEFAAAGADVLQTNSFGLLRQFMGAETGSASQAAVDWQALAHTSVALAAAGAKERPGEPALVVASLGPVGVRRDDAAELSRLAAAAEQLGAWFSAAGVSALHLETSCDPTELAAVMAGVRIAAPELPLLVSVTVTAGQSGFETPLGVPLARMLRELVAAPPEAVGVNCSLHGRRMRPVVAALQRFANEESRTRLPILAQPQVAQPAPDCKRRAAPGTSSPSETPEQFASGLLALFDEGADAVGGCCGATALHIRAARAAIDRTF